VQKSEAVRVNLHPREHGVQTQQFLQAGAACGEVRLALHVGPADGVDGLDGGDPQGFELTGDFAYAHLQLRPGRKPIFAGDDELRIGQPGADGGLGRCGRELGVLCPQAFEPGRVGGAEGLQQVFGLLFDLLQVRRGGKRRGHDDLLSLAPVTR
jgi:hypothetical protein